MMVLEPVNLLVDSLSLNGNTLMLVISVLVACYGLFLVYHALIRCLGARPSSAKILTIVLAVFNAGNTFAPLVMH